MRLLLLGAGGRLGTALKGELAGLGEVAALSRAQLDITDKKALAAAIRDHAPDLVINASAWTNVAGAEQHPTAAHALNADAVGTLGALAAAAGTFVVHFSTDFVFAGRADRPWREEDAAAPLNAYGASKLAGEQALAESGTACAILRTAWLYDAATPNFVTAMIGGAREGRALRVVTGEVGSPTAVPALARAVRQMLAPGLGPLRRAASESPLFHLACRGAASRYELACAAIADAGFDAALVEPVDALPASTVMRPAYSVLDSSRFERTFSIRLPHWRAALRPVARALRREEP